MKLAIKGHPTRGKEVIELLEMLGGKSYTGLAYKGEDPDRYYCINKYDNFIDALLIIKEEVQVFTLEEFLEKFPHKVGDKVIVKPYVGARQICEMKWDSDDNCIKYEIGVGEWFTISQLQPYKEQETMEEQKGTLVEINLTEEKLEDKVEIILNVDYEIQIEDGKAYIVKKRPQYPKTYEECCEVLNLNEDGKLYTKGYRASLIQAIHELLICRDAYWKIAGEQMGLGKPWEPDWADDSVKYIITVAENKIFTDVSYIFNYILSFPTEEMRDAFCESFKLLIEECKELL